jgi:hypothetical protein
MRSGDTTCALFTPRRVALESRGPEAFKTPRGVCVPFGSMWSWHLL